MAKIHLSLLEISVFKISSYVGPSVVRRKRFGLVSWVMGWGFLQTYRCIKPTKDNIRTLQEQNLPQQDQIIELTRYLNITYGHVSSNRYAITNLQVKMAEVNKH